MRKPSSPEVPADRFRVLSSKQFAAAASPRAWLVEGLLVAGQPAALGGPPKSHKTSVMVDLAVSLGTGTRFLNRFPAARRSVLVFSGEGDPDGLRDLADRVSAARGVKLAKAAVSWCDELPRLYSSTDLNAVAGRIRDVSAAVVVFAPLYLCLLPPGRAELAADLYAVGPILRRAADACRVAGATPVFVHHTNAGGSYPSNAVLRLSDLAYAGLREFARQWVLLRPARPPARPPAGDPRRRYVLTAGGGAGQSGEWDLTIDEGPAGRADGRGWRVSVVDREGAGAGRARPGGKPRPGEPAGRPGTAACDDEMEISEG